MKWLTILQWTAIIMAITFFAVWLIYVIGLGWR